MSSPKTILATEEDLISVNSIFVGKLFNLQWKHIDKSKLKTHQIIAVVNYIHDEPEEYKLAILSDKDEFIANTGFTHIFRNNPSVYLVSNQYEIF